MSRIEKLRDLPPKSIILFEASHDQNQIETIADLLSLLQDHKGVYVSSNMPTSDLIEKLQIYNLI
jgi:hypothetical protein